MIFQNEGFQKSLKLEETVLKSVSKEKLTNFEKTNLTYEKTDKKKK